MVSGKPSKLGIERLGGKWSLPDTRGCMAPKSDNPSSYGGVLTRPASAVVATLVAIGAVLTAGWKAHDVVSRAEAAEPTQLEQKIDAVARKQEEQGKILLRIQCRLGFEEVCPERPAPVRASGMGGR